MAKYINANYFSDLDLLGYGKKSVTNIPMDSLDGFRVSQPTGGSHRCTVTTPSGNVYEIMFYPNGCYFDSRYFGSMREVQRYMLEHNM